MTGTLVRGLALERPPLEKDEEGAMPGTGDNREIAGCGEVMEGG